MGHVRTISLCETPQQVLEEATAAGRRLAGCDVSLAAIDGLDGTYDMAALHGIDGPDLMDIHITEGVGLGGRVLQEGRPVTLQDYATESSITGHYKAVIGDAGLRGTTCVSAKVPGGPGLLLYAATREPGAPGARVTEMLADVAEVAAVTLHRLADRRRRMDLEILKERQRLASALHDSVAQQLFAIGVSAQRGRDASDPDLLSSLLAEIEQTAGTARAELRDVLSRLAEPLPGIALESLVDAEARLFAKQSGCRVVSTREGAPRAMTDLAQALVADVVREGLRNAVKHGHPRHAAVHLAYELRALVVTVQNENPTAASGSTDRRDFPQGSGLAILARRADDLGGDLLLSHDRDGAVVLRLVVPAPEAPTPS